MRKRFSVVIPAYNAAETIERCLDSVNEQTYKNYEIIVVNDGSIDDTDGTVKKYISSHPQLDLNYIVQENGGAAKARNSGIQAANGEYICFLDADDAWVPRKLEIVNKKIEETGSDVYYHDICEISMNGKTKELHFRQLEADALSDLIINGNQLATSSVVVKREKLLECNTFEKGGFAGEDIECWISLAQHGASFIHIPEILSSYNRNENSITISNLKYVESTNAMLMRFYDLLKDKYPPDVLQKYKQKQELKNNVTIANFYYNNRRWKQAAKKYKSGRFNHFNPRSMMLYIVSSARSVYSKEE